MNQSSDAKKSPTPSSLTQSLFDHPDRSARGRAWIALLVLLAVLAYALMGLFPRRVLAADAPADQFSGERAMQHLAVIAAEAHPEGSLGQAKVTAYLVQQLTAMGLEVEVQQAFGVENVVARLKGSDPGGAVLLQAHYDSRNGPGAGDNSSGTAALVEVMRALTAGEPLRNDVIALFDDGEELPDAFTGTKAFIRQHPWMADVRVAVGMDTAARGFISVVDTGGEDNGWLVRALGRAYNGGIWASFSGGGGYDTGPFKQAGVRVLELEDNYPFVEQHTPGDVVALVNPGTVQQMGDQALAIARELGGLDLAVTSGEQRAFLYFLKLVLIHYPESWSVPLAVVGAVIFIAALVLGLRRRYVTWRGLAVALGAVLVPAGLAGAAVGALWSLAPGVFNWPIKTWPEWPELVPPGGWWIFITLDLLVVALAAGVYRLARRWAERGSFALFALFLFTLISLALAFALPAAAIIITWPALIGSLAWGVGMWRAGADRGRWLDAAALVGALLFMLYLVVLAPVIFMSDGTKSVGITAGALVLFLALPLTAVDALLAGRRAK